MASTLMQKEGLCSTHPIMVHCYRGSVEQANSWRQKWPKTCFGFNVHYSSPLDLAVAGRLPLENVCIESDSPYLGKDPLTTESLFTKIAEIKKMSVSSVKAGILRNMLSLVSSPASAQPDMWPKVFDFAKNHTRKQTDMSVLHRHVAFYTRSEPHISWCQSDLENY